MILKEGQLEGAFPRQQPSNPSTVIQEQQHPGGAVEGVRQCLVISLDSTQLSLYIKPCGCRRTFPQEGIRAGTSWKRLPGRPRKTRTSQIPDDTGMSRTLTGMPHSVVAVEEGRYGL